MTVLKIVVLLFMSLLLLSCSNNKISISSEEIDMNKLNPKLKAKVKELIANEKAEEEIKILGKYDIISSEELTNKIEENGGKVETVTTTIFTANCSVNTITFLSNQEFIKYLELSNKMNLKDGKEKK